MKCKTPEELIMFDLLTAMLRDMPGFTCDDFLHRKKDRHNIYECCPVESRFVNLLDEARKFLSSPNASIRRPG